MGVPIGTTDELTRWLAAAEPGAEATYHTGRTGSLSDAQAAGPNYLSRLAREMRHCQERGLVYLVQRKRDRGTYDWLAFRSSRKLT